MSEEIYGESGKELIDLARLHDSRARELERIITSSWVDLADICIVVRDNQEWRLLGFHSWNAWIQDACPKSRSMAYSAVSIRDELREIATPELQKIPLGNAAVLQRLPKHKRQALIPEAQVQQPKNFLTRAIENSPEAHLEKWVKPAWKFAGSQHVVISEVLLMIRVLEDDLSMSDEDCLEFLCAEYRDSHKTEYEARTDDDPRNTRQANEIATGAQ